MTVDGAGAILAQATDVHELTLQWTSVFTEWHLDPLATVLFLLAGTEYVRRWRLVRTRGRNARVSRLAYFLSGIAVLLLATDSIVGILDTTLFSMHMIQHTMILVLAPPLLARGAPVTLVLQTSDGRVRRRVMSVLHAPVLQVVAHPLVAVIGFVVVLYATHFTFIYDAALRNDLVHELEHAAYLTLGVLLWFPIVGADPLPRRLPPPLGMLMLAVLGPYMAILGLIIHSADAPLFVTHATRTAALGMDPLVDQQIAGAIMWFATPLLTFPAFVLLGIAWARQDERRAVSRDRALARKRGPDDMTPVWWR